MLIWVQQEEVLETQVKKVQIAEDGVRNDHIRGGLGACNIGQTIQRNRVKCFKSIYDRDNQKIRKSGNQVLKK